MSTERRILLTGTPLMNEIGELWALLNFLMPKLFLSREQFTESFDFSLYEKQEVKMQMVKKLHKIMKPFMLRRTKDDLVHKLPDKIEINLSVPLSSLQLDLYSSFLKQLRDNVLINGSAAKINTTKYKNLLMQLRKVCNHPYLFEDVEPDTAEEYGEHLVDVSGKLMLIDKLLPKILAKNEQVLIFSQFTTMLSILEDYCYLRDIDYCRLDGATSLDDREAAISEFTAPNSKKQVFLISTRAGGLGLNLYTANHVVLHDSDWNPMIDLQAMDRAHRIG